MSEWFEKITDDFFEEQAVEDRTSVETVKEKFYTDLFPTDLAVQILDREGSRTHCQTSSTTVRTTIKH